MKVHVDTPTLQRLLRPAALALVVMVALTASAADETAARPPAPALATVGDICVAYDLSEMSVEGESIRILVAVSSLIESYEELGVAADELEIHVVLRGPAAHMVLDDDAWQAASGAEGANPARDDVAMLLHAEVGVEVCATTLRHNGWSADDVLPAVTVVPGAVVRLVDLQSRGCAYVKF